MKHFHLFSLALLTVLLSACSGSDAYRGSWKATNPEGEQHDLTFTADRFTIQDSAGDTASYGYSQHTISFENSRETYGITLDSGNSYELVFPTGADDGKGYMLFDHGGLAFTINRTEYVTYEESTSLF